LAFDASGALWVSNQNADTVVRFGASQLLVSGSPVPEATIGDDGSGDLERPFGLAFDASGDLWVANIEGPDAVLRFSDPGALSGSVDPTAAATLTGVTNPIGLAFDNSGSLWVVSTVTTDLYRFDAPGALSGAVSPAANASIAGVAAIDVGFISFFPPAEGLPIATP
jgi:sugar lactone lactonase YvrE